MANLTAGHEQGGNLALGDQVVAGLGPFRPIDGARLLHRDHILKRIDFRRRRLHF
jgi:hypothetical protein